MVEVLRLLSYVARIEREFMKRGQAAGIAATKAKSVKFGARPMEKPENFEEVLKKC